MPKHHKTAHHYSSHYKVGLGEAMLVRSRVIFLALIAILILSSGTAIYAGIKNGSLQKNIIEPSKQLVAAIGESFKESTPSAKPNYGQVININNVSGTSDIIIKSSPTPKPTSNTVIRQNTPTVIYYTTPPAPRTQTNTKSYEQSVQEMNERAEKSRQENSAWFDQQVAESRKRSEERSAKNEAEAKAWFDQKTAESQADLEAWKKEHGF